MKKLILIVSLLSAAVAYPQTITSDLDDSGAIVCQNGLYLKNDVVYTGKYITHYANGAVKEELDIKDGKLNGDDIKYFENGRKMEVGHYENSLKFGLWARY
ncbi:MAG: toxin-antitoxin system YwqK family antitoxin, partial [Bacteroidia bacterium]